MQTGQNSIAPENSFPQLGQVRWHSVFTILTPLNRRPQPKVVPRCAGWCKICQHSARGAAQQILREAEGYKEKRVLLAQGEAARFLSVLAEYEKAKEVTRERLHLETVERILPDIDKLIVDGDISQRLMPLLPVGGTVTPSANVAPTPLLPPAATR
jgi:hypothetical protein